MAVLAGTAMLWAGACGSGDRSSATRPPATSRPGSQPRAVGSPTTLPWWSHGRLHVDEGVIRTPLHEIVARGGTVVVGRTDTRGSTWRILRGDALTPLVTTAEQGVEPVVSANGLHVAWVTSRTLRRFDLYTTEGLFTVHAYDVARGREVGTTTRESRATCCDQSGVIHVGGVDNDGTVLVVRDYERVWAWRPGREPVAATGAVRPRAVTGNDQWPGGLSWSSTGDSSGPAAFGAIGGSGLTTRVGRVPQGQGGLWSPDGSAYVYLPFTKGPGNPPPVVWSSAGRVRLDLRRAGALVGWESPREVVVRTGRRPTVLVRCDARTGRCEHAGPPRRDVVLPLTSG